MLIILGVGKEGLSMAVIDIVWEQVFFVPGIVASDIDGVITYALTGVLFTYPNSGACNPGGGRLLVYREERPMFTFTSDGGSLFGNSPVYTSTDNGRTWSVGPVVSRGYHYGLQGRMISVPAKTNPFVPSIVVLPCSTQTFTQRPDFPGVEFLNGERFRVYVSRDEGVSWTTFIHDIDNVGSTIFHPLDSSECFPITDGAVSSSGLLFLYGTFVLGSFTTSTLQSCTVMLSSNNGASWVSNGSDDTGATLFAFNGMTLVPPHSTSNFIGYSPSDHSYVFNSALNLGDNAILMSVGGTTTYIDNNQSLPDPMWRLSLDGGTTFPIRTKFRSGQTWQTNDNNAGRTCFQMAKADDGSIIAPVVNADGSLTIWRGSPRTNSEYFHFF